MKEADPKMFLQLRNLPGHRRLAYLALTGDGRKGTRLDHPYQDAKRAQKVHRFPRKTQRSFKGKRDYLAEARGVTTVHGIPGCRSSIPRAARPRCDGTRNTAR